MSEQMTNPVANISWCALDVKSLYPEWTDEQCINAIDSIAEELEDACIALGWGAMESLLNNYEPMSDPSDSMTSSTTKENNNA
jgi:hypothetical protein